MAEDRKMKGTAEYVPDSDSRKGNADAITRDYFDSLLLELRHMGNVNPVTKRKILGHDVETPIMASPMALLERVQPSLGNAGFARGVKDAGAIMWAGWLEEEEYRRVADTGAAIIRGIKPFADEDKIFRAIETACETGAVGIFMDIDHCFDDAGRDCGFAFGQLGHKSLEQLKSYVEASKIPFLFKGILSPADIDRCVEVGAAGVMVSHHKGIWSYAVPPLAVLPEIRERAAGRLEIFADCGVRTGIDAFKVLARGADGAGVARLLMAAYGKGGTEAVTGTIRELTEQLAGTMAKTGACDPYHIDPAVIRHRTW